MVDVMIPKTRINNRRYLGNKYKLCPFIRGIVETECLNWNVFADIFSGTGTVASAFADYTLITNDILYGNYLSNYAWFGNEQYRVEVVQNFVQKYNTVVPQDENYMTENFADTYFSRSDCAKIGFIREDIEVNYHQGQITKREYALLVTSLLYAMDRIANTCGHYDAYRKTAHFERAIELHVPLANVVNHAQNRCYCEDANELVKRIRADVVYLDPPYNSRQYCDAYHLLENVACWQKPKVYGVARKMERSHLKSRYCTRSATEAFRELIQDIRAKYILLSYNNMGNKGNARSNARITDAEILDILGRKGSVRIFSESYKAFTTGKSDILTTKNAYFYVLAFETTEESLHALSVSSELHGR